MIGVDTNVIVRLFVEDDEAQCAAADRLVNELLAEDRPILVGPVVLVELVWALRRIYRWSKPQCLAAIDRIMSTRRFLIDDREAVETAIDAWRDGPAEFADYLIASLARERGARTTYTFDKAAARTGAFTLLS